MLFSSPIFLFGFLPLVFFAYYLAPKFAKNSVLLLSSMFFYAWGEVFYVSIMIVSIFSNYIVGRLLDVDSGIWATQTSCVGVCYNDHKKLLKRLFLGAGIGVNLIILCSFKYSNFIVDNVNVASGHMGFAPWYLPPVHLPLGISFFTFQAISYLVDVYRKETPAQGNIFNLALYISLFPQLIAGPIVRYHDIVSQITERKHSLVLIASGMQRFIFGLAKKMLIANPLGEVADTIFGLSVHDVSGSIAWLGILCYSLQILYDFSGYSDMAIGLGRMFGFRFLENFNYPYISRSVQEFWRRWHISLSTWFRDYLYIPLGGSRVGPIRNYLNLIIVFLLCGLWHGASWNFVIWGGIHGFFLVLERAGLSRLLEKTWYPFRHLYTFGVVIVAWVFFRTDDVSTALSFLSTMFPFTFNVQTPVLYSVPMLVSHEAVIAFIFGIIFLLPIHGIFIKATKKWFPDNDGSVLPFYCFVPKLLFVSSLYFMSILKVASSTYNPFIYFRF